VVKTSLLHSEDPEFDSPRAHFDPFKAYGMECVDIVDEQDNVMKTVSRQEMRRNNLRHRVVFVLVFNSRGELLVTKRTESKDIYPGLYELCRGGTVLSGESYEETSHRELVEEIGAKDCQPAFLFDFAYRDAVNNLLGKAYRGVYDGKITVQKEEVDSFFFASPQDVKKMVRERTREFSPDNLLVFEKYLRAQKAL